jgi:adenine-specific DNA-methyltransferase
MNDYITKFQQLLRELFQFDCADLDFGIYRIMNHKRDVVERFIKETLPKTVAEELDRGVLAEQSQAAKELEAAKKKVLEGLAEDALDAEGNLIEKYQDTKAGREYLAARAKSIGLHGRDALEAGIYNHLYAFFSRYYQDGDFISKRRYSKRGRYAIPYNGEEVYLYWANHDQYYVKTAEYFTDYAFSAPNGVSVHFKLKAVDIEQNNVKGEKRFFLPRSPETVWDKAARNLIIPFEFRPLTEQENITYGQKNQQEAIIAKALEDIPRRLSPKTAGLALAALTAERSKTSDGESVSFLEHHLRQYARRNTSDFFIHKDLKGFLSRELDFYLKNEVLNLDEIGASGEHRAEGWFQMMHLVMAIGARIIEFLHQIEEFQKMLWEKRKFITEAGYCITVGNIDESFHPEIACCDAQWDEWKTLFHIDEEKNDLFTYGKSKKHRRIAFLKAHPTLVLDSKHFDQSFVGRLIGSFDDLDEITDGLLIRSENWQAINLLSASYQDRVDCIHIDPPYNTDASGFVYKNAYRHSSWLSMMMERTLASKGLMQVDGTLICHIDENEYEHLRLLLEKMFGYVGTAVWDKLNPMMGAQELAIQHEYVVFCASEARAVMVRPQNVRLILSTAISIINRCGGVTKQAIKEFSEWVRKATGLTGGERAYQYLDKNGRVYRLVAMTWPNPNPPPPEFFQPLIHPVTRKPCPVPSRGWSQSPLKMKELLAKDEIIFGPDETTQPQRKVYLSEHKALSSVIRDGSRGKKELENLGLDFTYSHPSVLYVTLLDAGLGSRARDSLVLDFFAGSGTNGHAVINLNREDGGKRKFILVEMADYFDTVLLPRIKKVTFTPEWKDGKPKRVATKEEARRGPRIVKYIRLESYEDALNNISFDDATGQQAMKFEDYLLQYMLKWESRMSETLLNIERLAKPFDYKLHIYGDGQTGEKLVDIPETFAHLLGLHVQTRRVYDDSGRRYLIYRGTIGLRNIAVIWRDTDGWKQVDFERDNKFVNRQKLAEGADEIFVNGDSLIPNARALEPIFKSRMFAPVEA